MPRIALLLFVEALKGHMCELECVTCRLSRSHKKSADLLEKVKQTHPEFHRVRRLDQARDNPAAFKHVFHDFMQTLSRTSALCKDYLDCCENALSGRDDAHFQHYHSSSRSPHTTYRTSSVRFTTSSDKGYLSEDEEVCEGNQSLTTPLQEYGTYTHSTLPRYHNAPASDSQLNTYSAYSSDPNRRSVSFHREDKMESNGPEGVDEETQTTISVSRPRSGGLESTSHNTCNYRDPMACRHKAHYPPKSAMNENAAKTTVKVKHTTRPYSTESVSVRVETKPRSRRAAHVMRLQSRPRPKPEIKNNPVVYLHPGQSATVQLLEN